MHTSRSMLAKTLCAALAGGMIAMASAPAAYAQADKIFVMKLGVATINDTQHEWLRRFVAAVEKLSNGRIKGEIYPASQLGSIPSMIQGVQGEARSRRGSDHQSSWSASTSATRR